MSSFRACAYCMFYSPGVTNNEACLDSEHHTGECRAGPPKIAVADGDGMLIRGQGIWPAVGATDWCGAYIADPDYSEGVDAPVR